jgi:hypothetical protein
MPPGRQVVLHYGRSPLAFYVTHFYLIAIMSLIIAATRNQFGVPLPYVVLFYTAVIAIEYAIVLTYDQFKATKGPDSLWRLL